METLVPLLNIVSNPVDQKIELDMKTLGPLLIVVGLS